MAHLSKPDHDVAILFNPRSLPYLSPKKRTSFVSQSGSVQYLLKEKFRDIPNYIDQYTWIYTYKYSKIQTFDFYIVYTLHKRHGDKYP